MTEKDKPPPLPSLVGVTAGVALAGAILLAVPGAASVVMVFWATYVAAAVVLGAVAMGRDVHDAGHPGVVLAALVVVVPPVGVVLWWRWRHPGPVISPFARRLMVDYVIVAAACLLVLGVLVAVLHD
jgi:hypothetical protein